MSRAGFTAKYSFVCGCCGEFYDAGSLARYGGNGSVIAVDCVNNLPPDDRYLKRSDHLEAVHSESEYMPTEQEMAEARSRMCPKCFLVHAGECY